MAIAVYRALANDADNNQEKEEFAENRSEFEELAIDLMAQCHSTNPEVAQVVLSRSVKILNDRTCLELAGECEARKCLFHRSCNGLCKEIWNGHILKENSNWLIWFSMIFPPLLFFIHYRDKKEIKSIATLVSNLNL